MAQTGIDGGLYAVVKTDGQLDWLIFMPEAKSVML